MHPYTPRHTPRQIEGCAFTLISCNVAINSPVIYQPCRRKHSISKQKVSLSSVIHNRAGKVNNDVPLSKNFLNQNDPISKYMVFQNEDKSQFHPQNIPPSIFRNSQSKSKGVAFQNQKKYKWQNQTLLEMKSSYIQHVPCHAGPQNKKLSDFEGKIENRFDTEASDVFQTAVTRSTQQSQIPRASTFHGNNVQKLVDNNRDNNRDNRNQEKNSENKIKSPRVIKKIKTLMDLNCKNADSSGNKTSSVHVSLVASIGTESKESEGEKIFKKMKLMTHQALPVGFHYNF